MNVNENLKFVCEQNAPSLDTPEAKLNWIFSIYDADDGGRLKYAHAHADTNADADAASDADEDSD